MAIPSSTNLVYFFNKILTGNDWKTNFDQILAWLTDGTSDLNINSLTVDNININNTLSFIGNIDIDGFVESPNIITTTITPLTASGIIIDGDLSVTGNNDIIPTGVIVMWSGSIVTIPTNWVLCNGANGTPDLRDKFIVGAGTTYAVDATGGEATHTLTTNEIPSHGHESNGGSHGASSITYTFSYENTANGDEVVLVAGAANNPIKNCGGGAAHNTLPPYYALAYIMKI
jgi:hypothetical protein